MVFIYLFYYAISIIPIWIGIYYGRFIETDYHYNRPLKRKRILVILFLYFMMFMQAFIVGWQKIVVYHFDFHPWIIFAAIFFALAYITLAVRIEIPKRYPKKKRWK